MVTLYKQHLQPLLLHNLLLILQQMIYLEILSDLLFQTHPKQIKHPLFQITHPCSFLLIPQGSPPAYAVPNRLPLIFLSFFTYALKK